MAKKKKNKKIKKNSKGQLGKKRETAREKMIGQTIGYRYDVNLLPDYKRLTPFLKMELIFCNQAISLRRNGNQLFDRSFFL